MSTGFHRINRRPSWVWTALALANLGPNIAVCRSEPPVDPRDKLATDAQSLAPLCKTDVAKQFLAGVSELPTIAPRKVYRHKENRRYISEREMAELSEADRGAYEEKVLDESFYYNTKYGTPLAYVRSLDLLGANGVNDLRDKRIVDLGYGGVGVLRLIALQGAFAVGVDVDTLLPAYYSEPTDQGAVSGQHGRPGFIKMVHGQFPGDAAVSAAVGDGYDVFMSKNTLKNGYIHPPTDVKVDERKLIRLGVDDAKFIAEVHRVLKPGGFAMIYNICPAPAPPGKEYIPWADGRCPFARSLWESAGFDVLAFDQDDSAAVREMGRALGWDKGESPMDLDNDLFGVYTLARKRRN